MLERKDMEALGIKAVTKVGDLLLQRSIKQILLFLFLEEETDLESINNLLKAS